MKLDACNPPSLMRLCQVDAAEVTIAEHLELLMPCMIRCVSHSCSHLSRTSTCPTSAICLCTLSRCISQQACGSCDVTFPHKVFNQLVVLRIYIMIPAQ